jgi:hypothetical protein
MQKQMMPLFPKEVTNGVCSRLTKVLALLAAMLGIGLHRAAARPIKGQVFIVTNGGQTIKLTLVEVSLRDREAVEAAKAKTDQALAQERASVRKLVADVVQLDEEVGGLFREDARRHQRHLHGSR